MSEGRIVGAGRFRVDRARALEKIERFQLEDPHRYVLEWLAAAVMGGATRIVIENDADDFLLEADAAPPAGESLDAIFDHLWGRPTEPGDILLQHLGVGILGALALHPRWVRVDVGSPGGDLRLAVADPAQTRHERLGTDELEGIRCHVKDGWSVQLITQTVAGFFGPPTETHLVDGAARWCPVPVRLNGSPVARPDFSHQAFFSGGEHEEGWLFFSPVAQAIDVIRHGVVVGHLPLKIGEFHVGGHWRDDALTLNASRSRIVEDENWERVQAVIRETLRQDLSTGLLDAITEEDTSALRWRGLGDLSNFAYRATRHELCLRLAEAALRSLSGDLGGLEELSLLQDLSGRRWSLRQLRTYSGRVGVCGRSFDDLLDPFPVFEASVVPMLEGRVPFEDVTAEREERARGVKRRRQLRERQAGREPFFGRVGEIRFDQQGVRGSVLAGEPIAEGPGEIRIDVRIGGLSLHQQTVLGPGGAVRAIADDPRLTADPSFQHVVEDAAWERVLAVVRENAWALVQRQLGAGGPQGLPLLSSVFASRYGGSEVQRPTIPEEIAQIPVFQLASGPVISLDALWTRMENDELGYMVSTTPHRPADSSIEEDAFAAVIADVLVIPALLQESWGRWSGWRLGRGDEVLRDRLSRAERLAGPREAAVLAEGITRKVTVRTSWLHGEVGFLPGHVGSTVRVLREGVFVCVFEAALGLPGTRAVVEAPTLSVSPGHDQTSEQARIRAALEKAVARLALTLWDDLGENAVPPPPLMTWITANLKRPDLEIRPILYRVKGTPVTISMLRVLGKNKRSRKLILLPHHPEDVPGLDDCVVMIPGVEPILEALCPGKYRDGTRDYARLRELYDTYMRRPVYEMPHALWQRQVSEKTYEGTALIPILEAQKADFKARVIVLWRDRILTSRTSEKVGATFVIRGERLRPSKSFESVFDTRPMMTALREAEELLPRLVREAAENRAILEGAAIASPKNATREGRIGQQEGRLGRHKGPWYVEMFSGGAGDSGADRLASWLRLIAECHAFLPAGTVRAVSRQLVLQTVDGQTTTLDAVRKAAEEGAEIFLVTPRLVQAGACPEGQFLFETPWLAQALDALELSTSDGRDKVEAFRAMRRRKAQLARRAPVLEDAVRPVDLPAPFEGQLALGGGEDIQVEILVDGYPVATRVLKSPVAARAVVMGGGIEAAESFCTVKENKALERAYKAIRNTLRVRVLTTIADGMAQPWVWQWVLKNRQHAKERQLKVFPLVDGTYVSLQTLLEREKRDGGVGYTSSMTMPPQITVPPLLNTNNLRSILRGQITLVDLKRVTFPSKMRSPPSAITLPEGCSGWLAPSMKTKIELLIGGHRVGMIEEALPVPLHGQLTHPAFAPCPLFRRLLDPSIVDRIRDALPTCIEAALSEGQFTAEQRRGALMFYAGEDPSQAIAGNGVAARLAEEALYVDSEAAWGSLHDVLSTKPVRAVAVDQLGRPASGKSRCWRLTKQEVTWLRGMTPVEQADAALLEEEQGWVRRTTDATAPRPIPEIAVRRTVEGASLAVWRHDQLERWWGPLGRRLFLGGLRSAMDNVVEIVVDGRVVEERELSVPLIGGQISGAFETDAAFSRAVVPESVLVRFEKEGGALLQALARQSPERVVAALLAHSKPLGELVREPWCGGLELFTDLDGTAVSLQTLVIRSQKRLRWARPGWGTTPRVLALDSQSLTWVRRLLPKSSLVLEEEARQERVERSQDKALKKSERALLKHARQLGPAVRKALQKPGDARSAWLSGSIEQWDGASERQRWLLAYQVASRALTARGAVRDEVEVLAVLATKLT